MEALLCTEGRIQNPPPFTPPPPTLTVSPQRWWLVKSHLKRCSDWVPELTKPTWARPLQPHGAGKRLHPKPGASPGPSLCSLGVAPLPGAPPEPHSSFAQPAQAPERGTRDSRVPTGQQLPRGEHREYLFFLQQFLEGIKATALSFGAERKK